MTAYRQRALTCAALLHDRPGRPRDLRAVVPDAGPILQRNVYRWFERAGMIRIFRVDPGTGVPEPVGEPVPVASPTCVCP